MNKPLTRSVTIWGAVGAFLSLICSPEVIGILPEKPALVLGAVSTLVTVFGLRRAVDRLAGKNPQ